jgi:mannose-6-phosphate isomerase-like protein (cupin superfamily)
MAHTSPARRCISPAGAIYYVNRRFGSIPKEPAMTTATSKGYLIRRLAEAPKVPCPCGESTRPLTGADTPVCNLHVTFIKDSLKHYHKECTEVYLILDGRGTLELNDDVVEVEPGMVVYIEPYTAHKLTSADGVRTVVFGVPALRADDEYFV